eukprot:scaffold21.g2194.t1
MPVVYYHDGATPPGALLRRLHLCLLPTCWHHHPMACCTGLNARLQAWVLKSQIAAQVELTLFIAWKPGAWNPVCAGLKAVRPDLYDAVLKCQDYCAWDAGGADVEWLWGIRILWFRKQASGGEDCGPGSYTYDSNQQQCTPA